MGCMSSKNTKTAGGARGDDPVGEMKPLAQKLPPNDATKLTRSVRDHGRVAVAALAATNKALRPIDHR